MPTMLKSQPTLSDQYRLDAVKFMEFNNGPDFTAVKPKSVDKPGGQNNPFGLPDRDGDGTPDYLDMYPDDATKQGQQPPDAANASDLKSSDLPGGGGSGSPDGGSADWGPPSLPGGRSSSVPDLQSTDPSGLGGGIPSAGLLPGGGLPGGGPGVVCRDLLGVASWLPARTGPLVLT